MRPRRAAFEEVLCPGGGAGRPLGAPRSRVYDPRERLLLAALGPARRAWRGGAGAAAPPGAPLDPRRAARGAGPAPRPHRRRAHVAARARTTCARALPARAHPPGRGRWSEEVARSAPVDEVLVWSAPWAGRPRGRRGDLRSRWRAKARALRRDAARPRARPAGRRAREPPAAAHRRARRVGYANTGGGWLLTHVVPLDETVSWVEQNRRAVAAVVGPRAAGPADALTRGGPRVRGARCLARAGPRRARPAGRHPPQRRARRSSSGRWSAGREVARRLQAEFGAARRDHGRRRATAALAARAGARPAPRRPSTSPAGCR